MEPARLRSRQFRRLAKGKYVAAARPPSALLDAEAALLGHPPGALVTHTTAADVLGLPVPYDVHEHVGVTDPSRRRRRQGVLCHVVPPDTAVLELRGVRVAAPAYVFLQMAGLLPLVELVVLGDAIIGKGWGTPSGLLATCSTAQDDHAARALAAARLVRGGVDSPMETRLRLLLVLAGFPEPTVDHTIRDEYGVPLRRFDLCWPEVRVIVEYDGRQHASDARQYATDLTRREELDDHGWRIVVVTAEGIYARPEETVARVRKVLLARGMRDVPAHPDPRWRRHFPGRGR